MKVQPVNLGDAADILAGYAFPSAGYRREGSCRLVRGLAVAPQRLDWSEPLFWERHSGDSLERYELQPDDIVIAMDRPWISDGIRVATITAADVPSLLVQRVARLRPRTGFSSRFLYHLMCSGTLFQHLQPHQTETTVPHISYLHRGARTSAGTLRGLIGQRGAHSGLPHCSPLPANLRLHVHLRRGGERCLAGVRRELHDEDPVPLPHHKGVDSYWEDEQVNHWVPMGERPIPFERMIYLGDGDTDIPSMKMVRHQRGHSIAVFDPEKTGKAQEKAYLAGLRARGWRGE